MAKKPAAAPVDIGPCSPVGTLPLTVQARFDDSSITHVLEENLHIESSPGGPMSENVAPPTALVESNTAKGRMAIGSLSSV